MIPNEMFKRLEDEVMKDLEEKLPMLQMMMTLHTKDLARPDLPLCFKCGSGLRQKGVQGGKIYCPKCEKEF
jgi:hypothetical protein